MRSASSLVVSPAALIEPTSGSEILPSSLMLRSDAGGVVACAPPVSMRTVIISPVRSRPATSSPVVAAGFGLGGDDLPNRLCMVLHPGSRLRAATVTNSPASETQRLISRIEIMKSVYPQGGE